MAIWDGRVDGLLGRISMRTGGLFAGRRRVWMTVLGALTVMAACRLMLADVFRGIDVLTGGAGDGWLLLSAVVLCGLPFVTRRAQHAAVPGSEPQPIRLDAALAPHFSLDAEIGKRLDEVVHETDQSSVAIISQVRELYDRAGDLVRYLEATDAQAGDLEKEILSSVTCLVQIGAFVQDLPGKMKRDLHNIELIAREIKGLASLAETVQAVSMQSHLLAINAAIEASRAGEAGRAFKVVANEVRSLAANSSSAVAQINAGLARAQQVLRGGMEESVAESSQRFEEIAHASESIAKLQVSFKDITDYYRSRFSAIMQNNVGLAGNISEVLGQVQYQDVIRQRIERIQAGMAQRNASLQTHLCAESGPDVVLLEAALASGLQDYLDTERLHASSMPAETNVAPKIELF